jgi:hypothetical protein
MQHLLLRFFSPVGLFARAFEHFAINGELDAAPSRLHD